MYQHWIYIDISIYGTIGVINTTDTCVNIGYNIILFYGIVIIIVGAVLWRVNYNFDEQYISCMFCLVSSHICFAFA